MEARACLNSFVAGQEDYEVEEEIGHGTYSEVHRARDRTTHQMVALKEMFLTEDNTLPLHVDRELQVFGAVSHPHVLPLMGVYRKGFGITLVLPLCETDLQHALKAGPLPGPIAKAILRQLFEAVAALHSAGFAHRDLAPANILLTKEGNVQLCDFGQTRRLAPGRHGEEQDATMHPGSPTHPLTPGVGTQWYRAPELLFAAAQYTNAVDAWSLGMITVHVLLGSALCPGRSDIDQICRVQAALGSIDEASCPQAPGWTDWGKLVFPPSLPQQWEVLLPGQEQAAHELCQGLLRFDPVERWDVARALNCAYFTSGLAAAAPAQVAQYFAHPRGAAASA